jgi:hypothetical protein
MTSWLLRFATRAVLVWTHLYTWRLERSVRQARRAEIESDLWEQRKEAPANLRLALHIVGRLVLGVPDDVRWRVERVSSRRAYARRPVVWTVASAAVLACLWIGIAVGPVDPPKLPAVPDFSWRRVQVLPPPPPPPPPPCNPPGIGRPAFSPCTPL